MNQHIIIGRMGKDPEVKTFGEGSKVKASFSVATTETWKDKKTNEKKEATEWHNVVLWGQPADFAAKYTHKGDKVLIVGKVVNRSYEKQDGTKAYITETVADRIEIMESFTKRDAKAPAANGGGKGKSEAPVPDEEPLWMR